MVQMQTQSHELNIIVSSEYLNEISDTCHSYITQILRKISHNNIMLHIQIDINKVHKIQIAYAQK